MKYTDFTEFIKPVHFNSYSIQSNTSHCESFRIYKLLKNVVHIILLANLAESTLFQFPIHEKEVFELNKQKRCFRFPPSSSLVHRSSDVCAVTVTRHLSIVRLPRVLGFFHFLSFVVVTFPWMAIVLSILR